MACHMQSSAGRDGAALKQHVCGPCLGVDQLVEGPDISCAEWHVDNAEPTRPVLCMNA